jgi:hypothetical protein
MRMPISGSFSAASSVLVATAILAPGLRKWATQVALRLWAVASISLAAASASAAESATVPSPICVAADLRLVTLIEAHGEAQDVAPEILARAFFTVLEARKACNAGQVEAAMKLYEGIPLPEVMTRTQ